MYHSYDYNSFYLPVCLSMYLSFFNIMTIVEMLQNKMIAFVV